VRGEPSAEVHVTTPVRQLRQRAAERPDAPLLRFREETGVRDVGASELLAEATRVAGALRRAGAEPGDRVAVLLPNGFDYVVLWFAIPLAGLIEVPVNVEQRGPVLRHVLEDSGPTVIVAAPEMLPVIADAGYAGPGTIVEWGVDGREQLPSAPIELHDPAPDQLSTIMYTSGTTGPSKGVMLSHGYLSSLGANTTSMRPDLGADDVFYLCSPMFHVDARCMLAAALSTGGCFAFSPRFSARGFWRDVRDFGATFFLFIGAMLAILAKTSSVEDARGHRLKAGTGAPIPAEAYEHFEDRLGIRLIEVYGMTEAAAVTWSTPDRRRRGSAGCAAGPFDVAVVDRDDRILPPGELGEVVVRPKGPNLVTLGYWHRDDATVETFRNLWLHSGDLGRFDEDGFLWFVGREKDMIRRRGENISAFEVEATMSALPGVLECAAVPVPDELGGEEEILLLVVPVEGAQLDPADVATFASRQLARFAVPRWIDIVGSLPHTPTGKLAKHLIDRRPSDSAVECRPLLEARR
jgi:crotonobetaine/carnitine-CoA ligase